MKEYIEFEEKLEDGYCISRFHKRDFKKDFEAYKYFVGAISIRDYIKLRIELLKTKEVWDFSIKFN
jgi:hypothetical protein